mmetsp:Transcript_3699/g.4361  ORF Transcript_3699/g.4361 Transcript_3699/m.4361 type:complete len:635 (-) Transcript_3699:99-2003(-)
MKTTKDHNNKDKHSIGEFKVQLKGFQYNSFFKVFPLQQHAFNCVDGITTTSTTTTISSLKQQDSLYFSLETRLFAFEQSGSGTRKYVVAHLGRFLQKYWMDCEILNRHYYELIREGTPCRLYFDIEFNKVANPNIDDDANEMLMNEFISELSTELQSLFNITINRKNIVDLDSSTDKKFSRHLIIHLPKGQLFADAPTCGIFVKNFVGRLAEETATGEMKEKHPVLSKHLFLNREITSNDETVKKINDCKCESEKQQDSNNEKQRETPKVCFIDTGVYTRNRVFRILGSMKHGKSVSAALRIATANQFPFPQEFHNELFLNLDDDKADSNKTKSIIHEEVVWEKHAIALVHTFIVPMENQLVNKEILELPESTINNSTSQKTSIKTNTVLSNQGSTSNTSSSPYPLLDKFVQNTLAKRKGLDGTIRSWSLEQWNDQPFITYCMKGNRYCENINRSHKSNNIIWNVNISDGEYWQTCLDPECRNMSFRGEVKELPRELQQSLNDIAIENAINFDDEFENALLQISLDEKENVKESESINDITFNCDVDDDFNRALMELNLSSNKDDEDNNQNISNNKEDKNGNLNLSKDKEDEDDNQNLVSKDIDDSFHVDKDFELALMRLKVTDDADINQQTTE